jgi:hypothetical protein
VGGWKIEICCFIHITFLSMKIVYSFVLAIAVLCAATPVSMMAGGDPKLEVVGGDTYDWGNVKPKDSPLKAKIKLTNIGAGTLYIKEVKAGCGCTATKIDKDTLNQGESGIVDVSLNVATVTGLVTKTITVYSNDPANSSKIIYLKAQVVREVTLSMPYMAFNDLTIGKASKQKLSIKNNSQKVLELDNFEATNGLLLNLKKKVEVKPGAEVELEGTFVPQNEGYFNAMVKFTTNNPDFPSMEISAYGNVMKPDSPVYQK